MLARKSDFAWLARTASSRAAASSAVRCRTSSSKRLLSCCSRRFVVVDLARLLFGDRFRRLSRPSLALQGAARAAGHRSLRDLSSGDEEPCCRSRPVREILDFDIGGLPIMSDAAADQTFRQRWRRGEWIGM